MKIQYQGIKEPGRPFRIVNNKYLKKELEDLPSGRYRLTIEKWRKNKSLPQLGYLYAVVYPYSQRLLLDAGWELPTMEDIDVFWKSRFAEKEIVNRETGEIMIVPGLKREFTTTEMMGYIESIRNYCSEYLGGEIPDPETQTQIEFANDKAINI